MRIVSISPHIDQVFNVGEPVTIEVNVEYTLDTESGSVWMVVQGEGVSHITQYAKAVTRGTRMITLRSRFVVPDTDVVHVFTPIMTQGKQSTEIVDVRTYKVKSL